MRKLIFVLAVIACLCFYTCSNSENAENDTSIELATTFISPAFTDLDIPFEEYSIDASRGDTVFSEFGAILVFPANSMLDANGELITGEVNIKYRDFSSPLDYFISGIPMELDSNGVKYQFESSGMCELYAESKGQAVFVNPENQPVINLPSDNSSNEHNLYYLDVEAKNWKAKGKDVIADMTGVEDLKRPTPEGAGISDVALIPPVKPTKASGEKATFSIEIDGSAQPELLVYNNMKFEIDESRVQANLDDAEVEWENVKAEKTDRKGVYLVTFSKGERTSQMEAIPVFEGKDYDAAMRIFESKSREYEKLKKSRLSNEKDAREKFIKDSIAFERENAQKIKMNELIAARNAKVEARNAKIREQNRKVLERNRLIQEAKRKAQERKLELEKQWAEQQKEQQEQWDEQQKLWDEQQKQWTMNNKKFTRIMRSFTVDGFGVWNCDRPFQPQEFNVSGVFVDQNNEILPLITVQLVNKNFKGITTCYGSMLRVQPDANQMIWAVYDNQFIYLSYNEFKKCNFRKSEETFTIKMNVVPAGVESVEKLLELAEL